MTHYIRTHFADLTLCDKKVFDILRMNNSDTTNVLIYVDCPECIEKLKELVNSLKPKE